ncbi:MAG TPA: hypothetical protein VHY08_01385 [Bacillota bacterium]|nr:hypothetical protein [Bacillota bacterium]
MERVKDWIIKNWLETMIFIGILLLLFWRLGAFPEILDHNIDVGIHPQVNKVVDNLVVPGEITWSWQDLHQYEAGRSPVYGGMIELGLRLFGLTLFGIRLFPAIMAFFVLILMYFTAIKFFPRVLALIFIVIFSTAPWYLALARSGGIVGFSLNLAIVALCLVVLLINKKKEKAIILALATGISVALIPYGYAILRPLYPLLILLVILFCRKIKLTNLILFLVVILAAFSLQFATLNSSLEHFFAARGESSIFTFIGLLQQQNVSEPLQNIVNNFSAEFRLLFGLTALDNLWNAPIAHIINHPDILYYPRFLVPFFAIGFLLCLIDFLKTRSKRLLAPILFFFVAVFPGTVGSAIGGPCLGRDTLAVIPMYFFMAYAIYIVFFERYLERSPKKKFVITTTGLVLLIALISGYQIYNYFGLGEFRGERTSAGCRLYPAVMSCLAQKPDAKVLVQEYGPFDEYGAYVILRLIGGAPFQEKVKNGQITFIRNENLKELDSLIRSSYFDFVVTSALPMLQNPDVGLPVVESYQSSLFPGFEDVYVFDMKQLK